jgi:hypothetical protein
MGASQHCPACGYTKEDAQVNMDHHLCKNDGNAPWQTLKAQGGNYRPHYRKDDADRLINSFKANYGASLDRERVWLEVIDDLMVAIASNSARNISQAYNRAAMKIAGFKRTKLGS